MGQMDVLWFKQQQKIAGVTAEDIAARLGRDRSIVSHIYNGRQRMSLDWAQAFADALNQPVAEILTRAGVVEEKRAPELQLDPASGDVTPWRPKHETPTVQAMIEHFGGGRPGVSTWRVRSQAMLLQGYLPGDIILVDETQSELCRSGDIVVAQIYDWKKGDERTLLRRFEPPVLVASSTDPADSNVLVVDGNNVAIKGKVIASWRSA